ncbi:MAG: DUF4251 domain-containing protein [Flavobacteriaceae bacterium]
MEKLLKLSFVLLLGSILGCSSTANTSTNLEEIAALDTMVSARMFEVVSQSAQPMATIGLNSISNAGLLPPGSSPGRIDLTTNANYVRVIGDSVIVYLPYFGERQIGGGYNNKNVGIEFKGIPKDFEIIKNQKTDGYRIRFVIKNHGESYTMTTELFPNHNSAINVISSHRTPIAYNGKISQYSPDE